MSRQLYLVPWRGVTRFQEFCVGLLPHGTIIEAGAKVIFQISCASLDQDLCDWSIVSPISIFSVSVYNDQESHCCLFPLQAGCIMRAYDP
jgi:hypothetical protein